MKKFLILVFVIIISLTFSSCDKIKAPLENTIIKTGTRRIIIEEFTGHDCQACPAAAIEAKRLLKAYNGQVIPIAIHAGDPTFNAPHTGSGSFETDFTTPDGNAYASKFFPPGAGLPTGIISRRNNASLLGWAQWENEIITVKDILPEMELIIETVYNSLSREVAIETKTKWLTNGDAQSSYRLQVYIIESHIIDWQNVNGINDPNYEHNHVFRVAVNTTWGKPIVNTDKGSTDIKSYQYKLKTGWEAKNCEIVAFVYKGEPNYEVMQANIKSVKPQ